MLSGRRSTPTPTSETRAQEVFRMSSASPESKRQLALAWHCKAAYKSGNLGSHHKIWLDSVTPSTLQPRSSNSWFPPIWSPDGCNPRYKFEIDEDVIQIVITWLHEQHYGMVLTRHTHTYSLLAQGHRSGMKICRNTGYGVKPSIFIMSSFHDLRINIYRKKGGDYFLDNPHIFSL